MTLDPLEQPIASPVQEPARPSDGGDQPLSALTGRNSPYLTAPEAAAYLRFSSVRSLYKALKVDGIPCRRRGNKTLLFHRGDLDRWLAGASASDLRREARQGGSKQAGAGVERG